jgi:hypothetical protein
MNFGDCMLPKANQSKWEPRVDHACVIRDEEEIICMIRVQSLSDMSHLPHELFM